MTSRHCSTITLLLMLGKNSQDLWHFPQKAPACTPGSPEVASPGRHKSRCSPRASCQKSNKMTQPLRRAASLMSSCRAWAPTRSDHLRGGDWKKTPSAAHLPALKAKGASGQRRPGAEPLRRPGPGLTPPPEFLAFTSTSEGPRRTCTGYLHPWRGGVMLAANGRVGGRRVREASRGRRGGGYK